MGSAGAPKTIPLFSARAPPDNCICVHSICGRLPARPSPVWIRTTLRLTLFFGCLLTCHSLHAFSTLLRLHSCGNARTRDCGALTALACAHCPLEPHLIPQSPAVAKSCSNPRAHKAEVHYRRGTLVESRPCWQVVPLPSPAVPSTRSDEHLSDPESFCHSPSLPFPILIPSVTLLLCRFLGFPYTPILPPRLFPLPLPPGRKTNLKCPPFSVYYFMTHPLTTHFFFCV